MRNALSLLVAFLAITHPNPVAAEATEIAIRVDAGSVIADTARHQLGINVNYLTDSDRRRPAGSRSTASALREMGVRWLRYPGGEKSDANLWAVPPFATPQ
jgi:alpha-L-arabinofuranosidase